MTGSPTRRAPGPIYWTDKRIIAGSDPVEMGKNNSGVGVGGSMTHFAGYVPRLHPSDFEVHSRDGVAVDWPICYQDLKPYFERVERELPVAGQDWPWGDPHTYPHAPHPISGAAAVAWRGAEDCGIEMRVGPVSITNGRFGNRPHCIYRGFCLQGCKVNAKASPLITHLPDAIEHGVEVRADSMAIRVEVDESSGRCTGVTYISEGREQFQPADAVAVCGYAIETPRLLLHSTSRRYPDGLGNQCDQVGRYVMVQGATQVAARFPMDLRMYKAPPPEVSSEQFYETDPSRGFARGFSIQTVSPLPIGWAEHVQADGHWGQALRSYMRDYNHWTMLGVLCELLPHADNRVTLADEKDHYGMPVARSPTPWVTTTGATSPLPPRRWRRSGNTPAPRTRSRSTATPTWSVGRGWASPPTTAWSTPTIACGMCPTCSSSTGACCPRRAPPTRRW